MKPCSDCAFNNDKGIHICNKCSRENTYKEYSPILKRGDLFRFNDSPGNLYLWMGKVSSEIYPNGRVYRFYSFKDKKEFYTLSYLREITISPERI